MTNRYQDALEELDRHFNGPKGWSYEYVKKTVEKALRPPAEMEDAEVVRWFCPICKDSYAEVGNDRCCDPNASLVKLTGTLKRPKPQPVERTVSVPCRITGYPDDEIIGKPINLHGGERFYAFAEEDECHGKTGLLSFTWTEDPK